MIIFYGSCWQVKQTQKLAERKPGALALKLAGFCVNICTWKISKRCSPLASPPPPPPPHPRLVRLWLWTIWRFQTVSHLACNAKATQTALLNCCHLLRHLKTSWVVSIHDLVLYTHNYIHLTIVAFRLLKKKEITCVGLFYFGNVQLLRLYLCLSA